MSDNTGKGRPLSRREFLKYGAVLGAVGSVGGWLVGCASSPSPSPTKVPDKPAESAAKAPDKPTAAPAAPTAAPAAQAPTTVKQGLLVACVVDPDECQGLLWVGAVPA